MNKLWLSFVLSLSLVTLGKGQEVDPTLRFFHRENTPLFEYVATRHMEASNSKGEILGLLDATTTLLGGKNLTYKVTNEEGSKFIRNRVLRAMLEAEKKQVSEQGFKKFTKENYSFQMAERFENLWKLPISPNKKESFMISGFLLIGPSGELLKSEGKLEKNPSYWVRDGKIIVTYDEVGGVRIPVSSEFTGKISAIGMSFGQYKQTTKYHYTSVNGITLENQ